MTYNIGDEITLKVAPYIQESYGVPEIVKATVIKADPSDAEQPYRLLLDGQQTPSWLVVEDYEITSTPTPTDDLDIAQVLFDFRDNEITLRYAVDKLKGFGV